MITNFDSTEQSQEWNDLVKQYPAYPSIRNLWCRTDTYRPCERLLNDYTDIATHFAGIVRTAYMYCPKIMLTEAQLLEVVPEFLRTLVFARPRGDDQFADCTFSPSLDMSR